MHLQVVRPRTGCSFHAASLLRASAGRSDRRWCLRASRPYCWQACGTRISRPSACGGLATSIALFIGGGEGNPHEVLLVIQFPRNTAPVTVMDGRYFWAFNNSIYDALFSVCGG